MATAGSLVNDFVSQNALILIVAVLSTVVVIAASTYYVARNYMLSSTTNLADSASHAQDETTDQSSDQTENEKEEPTVGDSEGQDSTAKESAIDPVYYCEHIQGEIKKVKQDVTTRKICENLSEEEIESEKQRQRDQLEEIFRLMQEQQERFGISSFDEMQDQMRLYSNF
ncbi:hypothetical protein V1264_012903 [Littorina saxatilis]|uniref:Matrix-remodeling-associated protein 7 helical domain-containing protein n=1 Tax=Littorina saxatilis TaxID=31220 RepID=A0AAN9BY27_9CAEN